MNTHHSPLITQHSSDIFPLTRSSSLSLKICTSAKYAHAKGIWAHLHRQQVPLFPLQIRNVSMQRCAQSVFFSFLCLVSIRRKKIICRKVMIKIWPWSGWIPCKRRMIPLRILSYFMFHGLDVSKPQSFFKHLPILSFFESYVYQLDNINEELLQAPKGKYEIAAQDLVSCFSNDPFRSLVTVFEHKGLLTERIREELRHGGEYWGLERKLCHALTNKGEILIDDVMKAMHLRSFDYRVLSLLLYQLRGAKVEELHMEFFSISAFLTEISDDLLDYEDDVLENSFNILCFFIGVYGGSTAPAMLATCITEAESKYESLLESLDPQLSLSFQKSCAEAAKEGSIIGS